MTEEEWLTATDPYPMLAYPSCRASDRKLRHFAVACCDSISRLILTEPSRHAVEVARRLADSKDMPRERRTAVKAAMADVDAPHAAACSVAVSAYEAAVETADHAIIAVARDRFPELYESGDRTEEWYEITNSEGFAQTILVRDIFGNPFRPVAVDPRWLTSTVVGLTEGIYADRAFDRLPILADALQDAGCESESVLAHCRGDGPHVRGCWVVDLVLGKK